MVYLANSGGCHFLLGKKRLLTTSRDAGENMCYKDVMKLLKSDLKDFKNSCGGHFSVGSFHIKMLVLSLLDEKPENGYWGRENIRLCYVWALGRLIKCLTDEHLPHYFVSGMNVLSKISSKAKFDGFIEFLETRRRTYAAGLNKV